MNITFDALGTQYQSEVMEIFNHYILTSTAAFPGNSLPEPFFAMLLRKSEVGYPAYAVLCDGKVAGFCQLSPYNPFSTFAGTACVTFPFSGVQRQGHWYRVFASLGGRR